MDRGRPILFFDGVCNLCNRTVQFIVKRDKKNKFLFASLQSAAGQKAIAANVRNGSPIDSVLLLFNDRYYIKSTAFLHVLLQLGGFWKISALGFLLPQFIRDWLYDRVVKNRYRWFGRREECMMPTGNLKSRFLTD